MSSEIIKDPKDYTQEEVANLLEELEKLGGSAAFRTSLEPAGDEFPDVDKATLPKKISAEVDITFKWPALANLWIGSPAEEHGLRRISGSGNFMHYGQPSKTPSNGTLWYLDQLTSADKLKVVIQSGEKNFKLAFINGELILGYFVGPSVGVVYNSGILPGNFKWLVE